MPIIVYQAVADSIGCTLASVDATHVTSLIIEYRYWILVPLSFIEGPIVAFFAGTLAAAGFFNVWALGVFFFARDIIVDAACYFLGYFGGRTTWLHRLLRRLKITDEHLAEVQALWHAHPGKTMFLSKLAYGVAAGFIVVAGLVHMPFSKFIKYGSVVAILHYGILLFLGYFFGATIGNDLVLILENLPYAITVLTVIMVGYYFFRRHMHRRLVQEEERAARR